MTMNNYYNKCPVCKRWDYHDGCKLDGFVVIDWDNNPNYTYKHHGDCICKDCRIVEKLCGKCSQDLYRHNSEYCEQTQRLSNWHHERNANTLHKADIERKRRDEQ